MTEQVGLLGWPVKHSVSPVMHNAAFEATGLDWRYDLLPVEPEQLPARVAELLADGYRGFNATVPHKKAVLSLPQIEKVDPAVEAMGAANTLTRLPSGGLHAANTDWQGFRDDLLARGVEVAGIDCLILGTGGSAQAISYALLQMGAASLRFVSRNPDPHPEVIGYSDLGEHQPGLIVNCTPVGMSPRMDESPWPVGITYPAGAILVDLIYNPPVTRLMAQAYQTGAQAIGGLGMLIRQGALAFEQWTGVEPSLEVMETAARNQLFNR